MTVKVLTATAPLLSSSKTPADADSAVGSAAPAVTVIQVVTGAMQASSSSSTVRFFRRASAGSERRRRAVKAVGREIRIFVIYLMDTGD